MEEYLNIKKRIRNKHLKNNIKTNSKYISNLFTRTLLSVILVLIIAIFINISDENLLLFRKYGLTESLQFTKINNFYTKYFGDIIPETIKTTTVFENTNLTNNILPFNDTSYILTLNNNLFNYLESGIIVFIGEKENLGKTIIVQGIDGVDIWYSNLSNINVTLYDYVEKNNIIGEFNENKPILTFIKEGKNISYENYIN